MRTSIVLPLILLSACTEPRFTGVQLEAPDYVRPGNEARVSALFVFDGLPVPEGTDVRFAARAGAFAESGEARFWTRTDRFGIARATYRAPAEPSADPGDVIEAAWIDPAGAIPSATTEVRWWRDAVEGSSFQLTCERRAVRAGDVVLCEVEGLMSGGDPLAADDLWLWTESGTLTSRSSAPGRLRYAWTPDAGVALYPLADEPFWGDPYEHVYNPRDGIVTLVAYTLGAPDPVKDGDRGGPLLDARDQGRAGTSTHAPRVLWRSWKVARFGSPRLDLPQAVLGRPALVPDVLRLGPGEEGELSVAMVDENLNPVGGGCEVLARSAEETVLAVGALPDDPWPYQLDPVNDHFEGWPPVEDHHVTLTTRPDAEGRVRYIDVECPSAWPMRYEVERGTLLERTTP